jgi:murein DD-endopeptidase MepM/ murein hydrolase activator NlpD
MFKRLVRTRPLPSIPARFGIRSRAQLARDLGKVVSHLPSGDRYTFDWRSAALLRPDLSLPAYAGLLPKDGVSPIFNFFDRVGGARGFRSTVTRATLRDWRGHRLSYDEHDGTDFVCPPGTPLVAAAPGIVVAQRDTWLRGGLTLCVDHGDGVVTQYTHLSGLVAEVGQRVERGEVIALAGTSGFDMTQFFPWVPPHVHFMVWVDGTPVDPYLAPGESKRAGAWEHGNDPRTSKGPLDGDPSPSSIAIELDASAIDRVTSLCQDATVRAELEGAPTHVTRLALLEDSLHHERHMWPEGARTLLRSRGNPERVKLTLPLPAELYERARPSDTAWSRVAPS